jgi:hypothetical protein
MYSVYKLKIIICEPRESLIKTHGVNRKKKRLYDPIVKRKCPAPQKNKTKQNRP